MKTYSKYGILTHFKGNRTIKQILVRHKDKDPMDKKSGVIYYYQCGELTYDEEYIGETFRTFGEIPGAPEGILTHSCAQHPDKA